MNYKYYVEINHLEEQLVHHSDMFSTTTTVNSRQQMQQVSKKRTRKNTKYQKAVVGATLTDILAKRNQNPEVRQAQREQAIRSVHHQLLACHCYLKNTAKNVFYYPRVKYKQFFFKFA